MIRGPEGLIARFGAVAEPAPTPEELPLFRLRGHNATLAVIAYARRVDVGAPAARRALSSADARADAPTPALHRHRYRSAGCASCDAAVPFLPDSKAVVGWLLSKLLESNP